MPSVRIKRADYAPLDTEGATAQPSTFPRTSVANLFSGGSPDSPIQTTRPRRTTVSSPQDGQTLPSPVVQPRRPRAGSRVADHVLSKTPSSMRLTQRSSSPLIGGSLRRSSSSRRSPVPGMAVLEGSQAHVMIPQADEEAPGIIDEALSHHDLEDTEEEDLHHDDIVEHLDVIDAQVSTVSNLTNAANSILIPSLPLFYSRKPVVVLSAPTREELTEAEEKGDIPKGDQYEDALDRHVEDVLSKPSTIRRTLAGLWSFLKTPMGVIAAIYGFLVAFWGAAIVFFLAKFINFHNANTQGFWVEVSSQVVNGLFTVTGVGLIPARAVDTYRAYKIWHYKRRTRQLREKAGLPQLYDEDDLPDPAYDPNYVHVLSDQEQADLHYQQEKFRESQTWYRPHGTETHRIILCGTMWGLNRFQRPAYSTGLLIPLSFLCGIGAAVYIWRGGQKTKRTKEVAERLRAALAGTSRDDPQDCARQALVDDQDHSRDGNTASGSADEHRASGSGGEIFADRNGVDEKMTIPPI
ncbi:hypothetical protein HWV62_3635 [Athelia sp. TMB]|nr:hypothetical protein HWV62_3635 [Athelia sp. TMB]